MPIINKTAKGIFMENKSIPNYYEGIEYDYYARYDINHETQTTFLKNLETTGILPEIIENCKAMLFMEHAQYITPYQHSDYEKIKAWKRHILKLIKNPETYKMGIKFVDDKTNLSENSKEFSHDFILFVLIVLYCEIPYNITAYHWVYGNQKLIRKRDKEKTKLIKDIREICKQVYNFLPDMQSMSTYDFHSPQSKKVAENLKSLFDTFQQQAQDFTAILEKPLRYRYVTNFKYEKRLNNLLSREMTSKTGIRNLTLRYVFFCFDLKPKNLMYEIVYLWTNKFLPKDEMMYYLTAFEASKYLKTINPDEPNKYAYAFLGLNLLWDQFFEALEFDEFHNRRKTDNDKIPEIIFYIRKWISNKRTFLIYKRFIYRHDHIFEAENSRSEK